MWPYAWIVVALVVGFGGGVLFVVMIANAAGPKHAIISSWKPEIGHCGLSCFPRFVI